MEVLLTEVRVTARVNVFRHLEGSRNLEKIDVNL